MKCDMCDKDLSLHKIISYERFCDKCDTKLAIMFKEINKKINR
jgi:hypothetical protein